MNARTGRLRSRSIGACPEKGFPGLSAPEGVKHAVCFTYIQGGGGGGECLCDARLPYVCSEMDIIRDAALLRLIRHTSLAS